MVKPIARTEMREWVNDTVDELLELKHERILELGVGSGLLLYPLLEHCREYTGLDFSERSLDGIRTQLSDVEREKVTLLHKDVRDLKELPFASYDLIILNSVAQYFPGTEYLKEVVAGAMTLLGPGGCLFLGDIRSLPLLDAFHTRVQYERAQGVVTAAEITKNAGTAPFYRKRSWLWTPLFFSEMSGEIAGLGDVLIRPRRGRAQNEMNLFRYQVLLFAETPRETRRNAFELNLDWRNERLSPDLIRDILETQKPTAITDSKRTECNILKQLTLWWMNPQKRELSRSEFQIGRRRIIRLTSVGLVMRKPGKWTFIFYRLMFVP